MSLCRINRHEVCDLCGIDAGIGGYKLDQLDPDGIQKLFHYFIADDNTVDTGDTETISSADQSIETALKSSEYYWNLHRFCSCRCPTIVHTRALIASDLTWVWTETFNSSLDYLLVEDSASIQTCSMWPFPIDAELMSAWRWFLSADLR